MNDYLLFADATADLPADLVERYQVRYVPMEVEISGETISFCADWTAEQSHAFYERLRSGENATTTQITPFVYESIFAPVLEAGQDILYICFSSGLSNTISSAQLAAETLRERYPQRSIQIVDSLAATYGEGLVVVYAGRNREAGMDLEQNAAWLREHIGCFAHWFTVDDLMFLKRGGRISAATAMLGTALKLKPVMHVDMEGHLIPVDRVQGRKNSLKALAKKMVETHLPQGLDLVMIGHGDAEADAQFLAQRLKEALPIQRLDVLPICPVIGAHSGPGTIALFFFAKNR